MIGHYRSLSQPFHLLLLSHHNVALNVLIAQRDAPLGDHHSFVPILGKVAF